jgi:hypothetical protein
MGQYRFTGSTARTIVGRRWRGAGVADRAGFENRCMGNHTGGSNPPLSVEIAVGREMVLKDRLRFPANVGWPPASTAPDRRVGRSVTRCAD